MDEARRLYNKLYLREWRKNPENRKKSRAYDAKWRAANPELAHEVDLRKGAKFYKKRSQDPAYRAAAVARAKRWMEANPERARASRIEVGRRRRAKKLGLTVGPIDYSQIVLDSNGICGICGRLLTEGIIHYDHIIPIARGGSHTQDNIQLSHQYCNQRKNAKMPEECLSLIQQGLWGKHAGITI